MMNKQAIEEMRKTCMDGIDMDIMIKESQIRGLQKQRENLQQAEDEQEVMRIVKHMAVLNGK